MESISGRLERRRATLCGSTTIPDEERSFGGFVAHMHLAYLYLLHAKLARDWVDYRYRRRDRLRLLERVDGEQKRWELAKCVADTKCVAERWDRDHRSAATSRPGTARVAAQTPDRLPLHCLARATGRPETT